MTSLQFHKILDLVNGYFDMSHQFSADGFKEQKLSVRLYPSFCGGSESNTLFLAL